jgi:hypothetical protein
VNADVFHLHQEIDVSELKPKLIDSFEDLGSRMTNHNVPAYVKEDPKHVEGDGKVPEIALVSLAAAKRLLRVDPELCKEGR